LLVCATVTVPSGYAAGTADILFNVLSSARGATDTLHNAVTVNAVHAVTLTEPGSGSTGAIKWTLTGSLASSASGSVTFTVKIN
jgi:hypothetical protein